MGQINTWSATRPPLANATYDWWQMENHIKSWIHFVGEGTYVDHGLKWYLTSIEVLSRCFTLYNHSTLTNILSRKSRKFSKFRLWTDFSCTLFKICHVRNSGETWAETYLQRLPHWQPNVSRPQDFPGRTNRNLLRELKGKKSKYGQAFKSKARRSSKNLDQPDLKTTKWVMRR